MTFQEESHGRGVIETDRGNEIPVYYHLLVERQDVRDGDERVVIAGRLSVSGDPWLESSVIDEGRYLVLQDGRRLHVQVEPAGRGSTSLPFTVKTRQRQTHP